MLSVNATGGTVNDVPVWKISLQVTVEGHQSVNTMTERTAYPSQVQGLVGHEVEVVWHPAYPDKAEMLN
ncbi:MAG: hypothetical protein AAF715_31760 [Myxococcota bacterium]